MKRFVFLILMICLVIDDDCLILAKPNDVKCDTNSKDIQKALESMLNVGVTKLKRPTYGELVNGSVYETDKRELLFVKVNSTLGSDKMFNGEVQGLHVIRDTKTILAPRPITTGTINNKTNYLVTEYYKLTALNDKTSAELGSQLADMHLDNLKNKFVKKFGFHAETYCGFIPQNNTWTKDWITFITENRLTYQVQLIAKENTCVKKHLNTNYWALLKPKIPSFFEGIKVKPSLLHGNLKSGNVGQWDSKPVIFNPSAFFGHHEYDIAVTTLYGNYSKEFYDAYHKKIPKEKGFDRRQKLYQLFHHLNNWNQFGGGNDITALDIYEDLVMIYRSSLDVNSKRI